jgi:hypothetical protein
MIQKLTLLAVPIVVNNGGDTLPTSQIAKALCQEVSSIPDNLRL